MMPILASDTTPAFLSLAVRAYFVYVAAATIPALVAIGLYWFARERQRWKVLGIVFGSFSTVGGGVALTLALIPDHLEFYGWIIVFIPMILGLSALVSWVRCKNPN